MFNYSGTIPASKSLYNRALLVKSFFPELQIKGDSICDDVRFMKTALVGMIRKSEVDCGEAGTVFRFMAMRCSREEGTFRLKGSKRLLQRPQDEIAFILNQLSVNVQFLEDGLILKSEGWKKPLMPIQIPRARSSQFASGILLSAWNLPFPLEFHFSGTGVSEGYWQMSLEVARELGMKVEVDHDRVIVPENQKINQTEIQIEPDASSMFAVVACAMIAGKVDLSPVPEKSRQPDYLFLDLIEKMGACFELKNGHLKVQSGKELQPIEVSLRSAPDLFPVLAALCGFAKGTSKLKEAPQLAFKESNRLVNTQKLLESVGITSVIKGETLQIFGEGPDFMPKETVYDPDQDHRMAMAAALFRYKEPKIRILNSEVVKKSFPEFWSVVGLT